ncbi:MAG TPA: hypothetical protein VGD64_13895 [Acidisarcina sp.]
MWSTTHRVQYQEFDMSMTLNALVVFFHHLAENLPAILVTGVGAAVLMACALGCSCAPCRAKDRLFNREVY